MQLPDVNVLIYAHREDAPDHDRYAAWLLGLTAGDEPFAVAGTVLAGFLRIVTNPKIFDPPTPMRPAVAFCQRLVDWPRAVMIAPTRQQWDVFVSLCSGVQGPLVADAHLAALAIEHGCELITTASDFSRFRVCAGGIHSPCDQRDSLQSCCCSRKVQPLDRDLITTLLLPFANGPGASRLRETVTCLCLIRRRLDVDHRVGNLRERLHQAILHHVRDPVRFVERRMARKPDVQIEERVIR